MRSKVQSTRARAPRGGIWAAGAGLAAAEAAQQSAAGPICRGHPFSPGPGLGCSSEGLPSRIFASPTWNPTCKAPFIGSCIWHSGPHYRSTSFSPTVWEILYPEEFGLRSERKSCRRG